MKIIQGMYKLPQVGILAKNLLTQYLSDHGYYQVKQTPGLWRHVWRTISFTLVVDDFGIVFVEWEQADHLMSALTMHYENITIDWEGKLYCGIKIIWDYIKWYVDISMPRYVK